MLACTHNLDTNFTHLKILLTLLVISPFLNFRSCMQSGGESLQILMVGQRRVCHG